MEDMMDALNLNKKSDDDKEKEKSEQLKTRSEGEWFDVCTRMRCEWMQRWVGESYRKVCVLYDELSDKWIMI